MVRLSGLWLRWILWLRMWRSSVLRVARRRSSLLLLCCIFRCRICHGLCVINLIVVCLRLCMMMCLLRVRVRFLRIVDLLALLGLVLGCVCRSIINLRMLSRCLSWMSGCRRWRRRRVACSCLVSLRFVLSVLIFLLVVLRLRLLRCGL